MSETRRRLSAIMFSDIQGFSRMMGEDEEATLSLLDEHNSIILPIIKKNNGSVLKFIGDALLSSFDSAVDAVRAGTEIQIMLATRNQIMPEDKQIFVRIGIHIGDVVVRDNDIFGDGVNVASRIEPLAEPGGICITQSVYDMVRGRPEIKAVSIGMKELKNIKESVHIYKILIEAEGAEEAAEKSRWFSKIKSTGMEKKSARSKGISWKTVAFVAVGGVIAGIYLTSYLIRQEPVAFQPEEAVAIEDDGDPEPPTQVNTQNEKTTEAGRSNIDRIEKPKTKTQPQDDKIVEKVKPEFTNPPAKQIDPNPFPTEQPVQTEFMSGGIVYDLNGDGVGDARYWSYDSNSDGIEDYGGYDTNLNGKVDQWLYFGSQHPNGVLYGFDENEDGVIDSWGWDMDGDNRTDTWGWDRNGNNVFDHYAWDTNGDGVIDQWGDDTNEDGVIDRYY